MPDPQQALLWFDFFFFEASFLNSYSPTRFDDDGLENTYDRKRSVYPWPLILYIFAFSPAELNASSITRSHNDRLRARFIVYLEHRHDHLARPLGA